LVEDVSEVDELTMKTMMKLVACRIHSTVDLLGLDVEWMSTDRKPSSKVAAVVVETRTPCSSQQIRNPVKSSRPHYLPVIPFDQFDARAVICLALLAIVTGIGFSNVIAVGRGMILR
jgi:hypothetical protein